MWSCRVGEEPRSDVVVLGDSVGVSLVAFLSLLLSFRVLCCRLSSYSRWNVFFLLPFFGPMVVCNKTKSVTALFSSISIQYRCQFLAILSPSISYSYHLWVFSEKCGLFLNFCHKYQQFRKTKSVTALFCSCSTATYACF